MWRVVAAYGCGFCFGVGFGAPRSRASHVRVKERSSGGAIGEAAARFVSVFCYDFWCFALRALPGTATCA